MEQLLGRLMTGEEECDALGRTGYNPVRAANRPSILILRVGHLAPFGLVRLRGARYRETRGRRGSLETAEQAAHPLPMVACPPR